MQPFTLGVRESGADCLTRVGQGQVIALPRRVSGCIVGPSGAPTTGRRRANAEGGMSAPSQPQSHGTPAPPDVTALLLAWGAGDRTARSAAKRGGHAGEGMHQVTLGVSPATANRQWTVASAWVRRELEDGPS